MAATLSVRVQTGAAAGAESAAQTGIDLASIDNATNTLANRQANPVTVGGSTVYSFEKYLKLKIDVIPANGVTNFKMWSAQGGAAGAGTGLTINALGATVAYTQPVQTVSSLAVAALPTTQGAGLVWDTASYSALNAVTKYTILQLAVGTTAVAGNMAQVTLNYSTTKPKYE